MGVFAQQFQEALWTWHQTAPGDQKSNIQYTAAHVLHVAIAAGFCGFAWFKLHSAPKENKKKMTMLLGLHVLCAVVIPFVYFHKANFGHEISNIEVLDYEKHVG